MKNIKHSEWGTIYHAFVLCVEATQDIRLNRKNRVYMAQHNAPAWLIKRMNRRCKTLEANYAAAERILLGYGLHVLYEDLMYIKDGNWTFFWENDCKEYPDEPPKDYDEMEWGEEERYWDKYWEHGGDVLNPYIC